MNLNIVLPETYIAQAKRYWRRRKYKRLHDSVRSKRKLPVLKLGSNDPDYQQQLKLKSPRKLLVKFREAYINTMLRWSTKLGSGRVRLNLYKRKHKHAYSTMAVNGQQVDAKVVMAIYLRMVADRDHHPTASSAERHV